MERRVIYGFLGAVLAVCVVGIVRERRKLMGGSMPHYGAGELTEREDGSIRVYPDYDSGKVVMEVGAPDEEPDFTLHIPPSLAYDTARSISICCMKIEDHRGAE